jgi:hypothetical protein
MKLFVCTVYVKDKYEGYITYGEHIAVLKFVRVYVETEESAMLEVISFKG